MMMPSKELLSEILRMEIISLRIAGNFIMFNVYTPLGKDERGINIYELMHLMKEWALIKDFNLHIYKVGDEYWCDEFDGILPYTIQTGSTEAEAVFKACEYILEQTNEPK